MPSSNLRHALILLSVVASPAAAQLSLREAIGRADRHAFANRAAVAAADAQSAEALRPYRGILPAVRVDAGLVRTTDPIAAFGTKLRQRAIAAPDFDPARLNFPDAIGNVSTAVVVEQPLVNVDAWLGRGAAADATRAARAAADWKRVATRVDVVRAYYGAILAREAVTTLAAAERAAAAHVARAKALADTGLVTRADVLLADVRAGEVTATRLAAAGDADHAARAIAVLIGEPGAAIDLPTTLPSIDAIRALVAPDTLVADPSRRADVEAATRAAAAARADARRAGSTLLPRLNGFARYDWNDRAGPFTNGKSWTAGVMASWSPFTGASELAEARGAGARHREAEARRDGAIANAALETERTRASLGVALARLAIAERGVAQADEALRIVRRKYDGGLATISELLEAQALATRSTLALSEARYGTLVAAAERRQALGGDPSFLAALDHAAPIPDRTSH